MAKDAIVVFNGCFCPVHAGHVKALEDTKRKVEARGDIRVVAGYFAVATDGYLRGKLGTRLEPWMTADSRIQLCQAVAQDLGWSVSAATFSGATQCGAAMIEKYHHPSTIMFSVRAEAKKGGVSQAGDDKSAIAQLSSTKIRAELAQHGCTPLVVDALVRRKLLGNAVGECLKLKFAGHQGTLTEDLNADAHQELCARIDGYMPKGFERSGGGGAEIAKMYGLKEAEGGHACRDRANVDLADALVAFLTTTPQTGRGTMQTCAYALSGQYQHVQLNKPADCNYVVLAPSVPSGKYTIVFWDVSQETVASCAEQLRSFLEVHRPRALMVSGPLERTLPGIEKIGAEIFRCAMSSNPSPNASQPPVAAARFRRRVVLVGIGGASGSGKSTLAKTLANRLSSPVAAISADTYNSCTRQDSVWGPDWERPEGVQFKLLRQDIKDIVEFLVTSPAKVAKKELHTGRKRHLLKLESRQLPTEGCVFVIVEGFLLFYDPEFASMCDVKIWVDADCETCLQRRFSRRRKNRPEEFADWYRGLVWTAYLEHKPTQLANVQDALHVCGVDEADVVAANAETHCLQSLNARADDSKGYNASDDHAVAAYMPDMPHTEEDEKPRRCWRRPAAA